MERESLTAVLRRAAEDLGYVFYIGSESLLAAKVTVLPAVWLTVPVLKRVSGRRERRDTYAVRLRLMMAGVPDDAGSREVWRILEVDAAALYGAVRACERVRSVRGLKVSPETKPLTPRGETAVAAEFEAEMFYCD